MRTLLSLFLGSIIAFSANSQDCFDLGGIDFGDCEMAMGVGLVNGECIAISGCGWEVGGVDYSPYSFQDLASCQACIQPDCMDVGGIDFGLCDMAMGIALYDGECVAVSGCGWQVGGVDYSPYFYDNIEDCEGCLGQDCYDMVGVDFGDCEAELGVGLINGSCTYISGCSWFVNGTNYAQYSFETMEDCQSTCGSEETCVDLVGIDFGPCDAVLGVGIIEGSCVWVSGCGWEVGGVDYSAYSFETIEDCQFECDDCFDSSLIGTQQCDYTHAPVCGCDGVSYYNACVAQYEYGVTEWTDGACNCPDATIIDPMVLCTAEYDPVCGCDGETYGNPCIAWYSFGISEWEPGECTNSVSDHTWFDLSVWPNPVSDILKLKLSVANAEFVLFDTNGRMLKSGILIDETNRIDLGDLASGVYILEVQVGQKAQRVRVIKE